MKSNNTLDIVIKDIDMERIIEFNSILLDYLDKNNLTIIIKDYIIDNINDKDGSPAINNLHIKDFQYKKDDKTGKFRLQYDIERIFCCSDIEASKPDYIDFTFHLKNNDLLAHAEYFNWELNN